MRAYDCPIHAAMEVVSGKWKISILLNLLEGSLRYGELRRRIPWCSEKVLVQQLRQLEADGLVSRQVFASSPPRVDYDLTEYGSKLIPILNLLLQWGKDHVTLSSGLSGG